MTLVISEIMKRGEKPQQYISLVNKYRNSSEQGGSEAQHHHLILQVPVVVQEVRKIEEIHTRTS